MHIRSSISSWFFFSSFFSSALIADAVDEIDVPGKEDNRDLEEHKLSIQESSVPWRLSKMDVTPSERASEDPHDEFGNKIPASQDEGQREGSQEDEKPPQLDGIQEQRDLEVKITLGGDSDEEDNEEVRLLGDAHKSQTTTL